MLYDLTIGALMLSAVGLLIAAVLRGEQVEAADPRDAHGPDVYDHAGED